MTPPLVNPADLASYAEKKAAEDKAEQKALEDAYRFVEEQIPSIAERLIAEVRKSVREHGLASGYFYLTDRQYLTISKNKKLSQQVEKALVTKIAELTDETPESLQTLYITSNEETNQQVAVSLIYLLPTTPPIL